MLNLTRNVPRNVWSPKPFSTVTLNVTAMLDLLAEETRAFAVEQAGRLLMADDPGPRVRDLRDRFGFTQAELADCLDLRRETLSRIESGGQRPSADVLRELVRVATVAHDAREHAARAETEDRRVDLAAIRRTATALRLDADVADDVVMQALADYGGKRKEILDDLEGST